MDRQNVTTAVIVPAAQAAISGVLFGAMVVSAWALSRAVTGWRVFWLSLAIGAFVGWLFVLRRWLSWGDAERGITQQETTTTYPAETINLAITWADGQAGDFANLQVDYDRFAVWCVGVAAGQSLGENHWCGRSSIFSKGEYHLMRDQLERRGIVRMRTHYHAGGYELTNKGKCVVSEVARRYNHQPAGQDLKVMPALTPVRYLREHAREEVRRTI